MLKIHSDASGENGPWIPWMRFRISLLCFLWHMSLYQVHHLDRLCNVTEAWQLQVAANLKASEFRWRSYHSMFGLQDPRPKFLICKSQVKCTVRHVESCGFIHSSLAAAHWWISRSAVTFEVKGVTAIDAAVIGLRALLRQTHLIGVLKHNLVVHLLSIGWYNKGFTQIVSISSSLTGMIL